MPKRYNRRTMRGGFLDDISNTLSEWGSSLSEGASSVWQKTKDATSNLTETTPTNSYMYSSNPPQTTTSTFGVGGKKRRTLKRSKRHMRGGFQDNTPITGLAAHASPVGGGRTRRRGRKGGFLGEAINQAIVPIAVLGLQQNYRRKKGGKSRRHYK